MAGKSATLSIKIVSDAKGASQGFADAESRVQGFQRGLDRASVAAGGVLVAVAAVAKEAYDAASALQQSSGAVESVFGAQAAMVREHAQAAAQAVGLAESAYNDLAAVLGSQLRNMGYTGDKTVQTTNDLIEVGADLAATFGGDTSDAVEALSSLLRGERDPIERYGIAITQAAVDAKVAALGLDTSTEAAKRNSAAAATLALVQEQAAAASGAFSREADTAAGQTQRAAAEFENAKAALGDVLLPIVAAGATKFAEFTQFLTEHKDAVTAVTAVVVAFAAAVIAVNAAMAVYRTITVIATAMQWLFNAAMYANPLTWIVIAIIAVIAAVVLMYNKFEWFRDFMQGVGDFLGGVFDGVMTAIEWVVDKLSWIGDAASWVGDLFSAPLAVNVSGGVTAGAGMFGSAGGPAPAMRGAALGSLTGGTSPSAGQGSPGMVVNVTVQGAIDPVGTGRTIEKVLREYGSATGRKVSLTMGRTP